jgi:hypothetical protein
MVTAPFLVGGKLRVWTTATPLKSIASLMAGCLDTANPVDRGSALLLDIVGIVMASSGRDPLGKPLADRAIAEASRRASSGTVGGRAYASAPVAGTSWHVVFAAPAGALLAPVAATRRVAWQLFGGIGLAVLCMLGAAFALRSAHCLAYARLHDALTGLPNRKVFMQRTERHLPRFACTVGTWRHCSLISISASRSTTDTGTRLATPCSWQSRRD